MVMSPRKRGEPNALLDVKGLGCEGIGSFVECRGYEGGMRECSTPKMVMAMMMKRRSDSAAVGTEEDLSVC